MAHLIPSETATQEKSSTAEIIPFENPARQAYEDAIRLWCVDRSLENALSQKEIGALPKFDRIDAQRKALLLNLIHYYRTHGHADVAPGVAVIVHLLSDNDQGGATVSQEMMAKLFSRSRSSISEAQKRLREGNIIATGKGRYAASYPIIPRAVTQSYNHLTWLLSAASAADKPLNLPARPDNCQMSGQTRQLNQSSGRPHQLEPVNCPVEANSIVRPDPAQIHYKNSTALDKAAAVAAMGIASAIGALPAAAAPVDPPAIVRQSGQTISHKELSDKLYEAAGHVLDRTRPDLEVMAMPRNWLDNGCDLELDILPTIRSLVRGKKPASIGTWKYFDRAIADNKATRLAPARQGIAAEKQKPLDRKQAADDAWFDREWAEFEKSRGNS